MLIIRNLNHCTQFMLAHMLTTKKHQNPVLAEHGSQTICILICVHAICQLSNTITLWQTLLSRPAFARCCHTDRMIDCGLHQVRKQPMAQMLWWVWETLWASTTCSISHILSHLRGHISSGPQPNYSTTHLTAIKRGTAGVQGSRAEPGCCHGHCHSADFQGWMDIRRALWLLVALFRPTETGAVLQTVTDSVVWFWTREYAHLWTLADCSIRGMAAKVHMWSYSPRFVYLINH